ncbi:(Fe-S)-binding protein [Acidianus sp. HS-5]|uniref:(Fe-S)-binding protein n=1 Tax=Acidianus sp. HS-5 TaxID=2886040 RepID=UPI001F4793E9|nr:(Fe-S)-binding protein [Acidianus sp. HS-5]
MPFPVDKRVCSSWAKDLPRGGDTIIYTSCMYQIEPSVGTFLKLLPSISSLKGLMPLARVVKPSKTQLERAYRILNNIVIALKKSGINTGYLYEDEPYSGAILLEMGFLDEFGEYARKVVKLFKEKGVKRIITVDPHTHNALTRYKEFVNHDIDVVNYLELVNYTKEVKGEFTIHDSCLYSRFLGLREKYRELLRKSGIKLIEDEKITGKDTSSCCGGPLGPVDLKVSEKIAENRAKDLEKLNKKLLVVCPICYVTLLPHFSGEIKDISEVIF